MAFSHHFAPQQSPGPNVRFGSKTDIGTLPRDVRFVREADSCTAAKASLFRRLRAAGHRSRSRRALGAIITTIGDVVGSSRNLVRYAGMVKSRLDEQPSFPRGAAHATWARRG